MWCLGNQLPVWLCARLIPQHGCETDSWSEDGDPLKSKTTSSPLWRLSCTNLSMLPDGLGRTGNVDRYVDNTYHSQGCLQKHTQPTPFWFQAWCQQHLFQATICSLLEFGDLVYLLLRHIGINSGRSFKPHILENYEGALTFGVILQWGWQEWIWTSWLASPGMVIKNYCCLSDIQGPVLAR